MTSGWSRRALLRAGAGALLVGCTADIATPSAAPTAAATGVLPSVATRPNSPLAANALLDVWPDQIRKSSAEVREAYDYAVRGPKSLQYIPCYCGCGASGHQNNQDCYVKTFASGGWVVLDLHGYG